MILLLLFRFLIILTLIYLYHILIQLYHYYLINMLRKKTVHTTIRFPNSWFAPNLLHERHKRRQLERAWRKSQSDNDRFLYRNQCRLYNLLLKKAKSIYFSSLFVNCSDSKSLWYSIDKVLNCSSTSLTDPPASLSAHQFHSCFSDKIKSLRAPYIN